MMNNFTVFDMRSQEINEDDVVVCAFVSGSSATLRIGRVVEKKVTVKRYSNRANTKYNYYLKIRWSEGTSWLPEKPTLISVRPNDKSHLLKVELDGIA